MNLFLIMLLWTNLSEIVVLNKSFVTTKDDVVTTKDDVVTTKDDVVTGS